MAEAGGGIGGDVALEVVADGGAVAGGELIEPVRGLGDSPALVAGEGVEVVRARVRDDLARRIVAEREAEIVPARDVVVELRQARYRIVAVARAGAVAAGERRAAAKKRELAPRRQPPNSTNLLVTEAPAPPLDHWPLQLCINRYRCLA
jgi:hypothetical protein